MSQPNPIAIVVGIFVTVCCLLLGAYLGAYYLRCSEMMDFTTTTNRASNSSIAFRQRIFLTEWEVAAFTPAAKLEEQCIGAEVDIRVPPLGHPILPPP